MKRQKVLFAVKNGAEDWQEELITEVEARIPAAKEWAARNGYGRFRVAVIDDSDMDFKKTVKGGK